MRKNLGSVLQGFFSLVSFLIQFRPDVIECFTHDADTLGIPAAWLAGVKGRFGTHHGQFVGQSGFARKLHTRIINSPLTNQLICVSERAKRQALSEGIRPEKIKVIFNGVKPVTADPEVRSEVRAELGLKDDDVMVLNVGRLVPEKAQQHLVTAAEKLMDDLRLRFFIAGPGPCRDTLKSQIEKAGLEDRFRLLGGRSDVDRLLNAADIFVLYSDTEGMPVSLMEAMSAGLPCIASNLEGIAQLIPDETYGTLIPAGDPDLLAETLRTVLADPVRSAAQGKAAAERIRETFSLDASCRQYWETFRF